MNKEIKTMQVGSNTVTVGPLAPILTPVSLGEYVARIKDMNDFDRFLSTVTKAYTDNEKAVYEVDGIPKLEVYYDGSSRTWMGNHWSKRSSKRKCNRDGHLQAFIPGKNGNQLVERLIKVAHAIETETLPLELHALEVNVMDLTGNEDTATELGTVPNFRVDNLEFAISKINGLHPFTVKEILKLTGRLYKIPQNDIVLPQIVKSYPELVQKYLDLAGYSISK